MSCDYCERTGEPTAQTGGMSRVQTRARWSVGREESAAAVGQRRCPNNQHFMAADAPYCPACAANEGVVVLRDAPGKSGALSGIGVLPTKPRSSRRKKAAEQDVPLPVEPPAQCPKCKAKLDPPAWSCPHCHQPTVKIGYAPADMAVAMGHHPLYNPIMADILDAYVTVSLGGQKRDIRLAPQQNWTDLQGTICLDPMFLGPEKGLVKNMADAFGSAEHEMAHEKHTSHAVHQDMIAAVIEGRKKTALGPGAVGILQDTWNLLEDGRIEHRVQDQDPYGYRILEASDVLRVTEVAQPWTRQMGTYERLRTAMFYEALPPLSVPPVLEQQMGAKEKDLWQRQLQPLVREAVATTTTPERCAEIAEQVAGLLEKEGIVTAQTQVPAWLAQLSSNPFGGQGQQAGSQGQQGSGGNGGGGQGQQQSGGQGQQGGSGQGQQSGGQGQQGGGSGGQGQQHCPHCGAFVDPQAPICGNCGNDPQAAPSQQTGAGAGGQGQPQPGDQGQAGGGGGQGQPQPGGQGQAGGGGGQGQQQPGGQGQAGGDGDQGQAGGDGDQGQAGGDGGQGQAGGDGGQGGQGGGGGAAGVPGGTGQGDWAKTLGDPQQWNAGIDQAAWSAVAAVQADVVAQYQKGLSKEAGRHRKRFGKQISEKRDGDDVTVPALDGAGTTAIRPVRWPTRHGVKTPTQLHNAARSFYARLQKLRSRVRAPRTLQKSGRLDRGRLTAAVKGSDRVFKRPGGLGRGKSRAWSIVLDASSSMLHREAETQEVAAVIGETLHMAGDPFELTSFADGTPVGVLKTFSDEWDPGQAYAYGTSGCTDYTAALTRAAYALSGRDEEARVLIFVTDGGPSESRDWVRDHLTAPIRKAGHVLLPVFVGADIHDSVAEAYDEMFGRRQWIHIRDINDLGNLVYKYLEGYFVQQ